MAGYAAHNATIIFDAGSEGGTTYTFNADDGLADLRYESREQYVRRIESNGIAFQVPIGVTDGVVSFSLDDTPNAHTAFGFMFAGGKQNNITIRPTGANTGSVQYKGSGVTTLVWNATAGQPRRYQVTIALDGPLESSTQ